MRAVKKPVDSSRIKSYCLGLKNFAEKGESMKREWSVLGLGVAALFLAASEAGAGATIKIDDTRWISVGAGLRTSFRAVEDGADNGKDYSNDFELESIRLYLGGQVHKNIKFTFNTERQSDGDIRVLDGIVQFEFSDLFNIWAGRFLPPSDRSNLSGPYYLGTFDFPMVQAYPAIFAGRDDGAAVWGQVGKGQFKYQLGAFQGRDGGSNDSDNLLYAGRLTLNLWELEGGYYNSSTYHGTKDVLAIGLVTQFQKDGAGSVIHKGDFLGWNVDFLMEKKVAGGGAVTLEGAYYDYDLDDVVDPSLVQGNGWFGLVGYLIPSQIGWGRFQPHVRYQKFHLDFSPDKRRYDVGVNYVIDGHNARASVIYFNENRPGKDSRSGVLIGFQLQL
jgi:hypothetical protein